MGMYIGGQPVKISDWPTSPLNKTKGAERGLPPFALKNLYLRKAPPLEQLDSWLSPDVEASDYSFEQFLRANGASDEAIRLLEVTGERTSSVSTLDQMRNEKVLKSEIASGPYSLLEGGMSRLPEAMASRIQGESSRTRGLWPSTSRMVRLRRCVRMVQGTGLLLPS